MGATEIKTGSYSNFDTAMETVDRLNKALESRKTEIEGYKNSLNDESVFAGPMCDSAVEGFTSLGNKILSTTGNFSTIKGYVSKALTNYLDADNKAVTYLDIKDGKIIETSTPPVSIFTGTEIVGNLSGNTTQEKVYDYLKKAGFNSAVISGIMANINAESGFQTEVNGDYGKSHGLCQWYSGRNTNLHNYCKENNLDVESVEGQMAFMMHELNNGYKNSVLNKLKDVPNTKEGAYEAASIWTKYYEIPANTNAQADSRGKAAQSTYWDMYGKA